MRVVEKAARTADEAVALALEELGVGPEQVIVEVLEEGQKGFLGLIGAKSALVRVKLKETKVEMVQRLLAEVFRAMGVVGETSVHDDGQYVRVEVRGRDASILIGHHGQTLDALQFLLNVASNRMHGEDGRILLDVEGYRKRREETLTRVARRVAERVRRSGEAQALEPMSAQERRVIHLALADDPYVVTVSQGNDAQRRVVIQPKR